MRLALLVAPLVALLVGAALAAAQSPEAGPAMATAARAATAPAIDARLDDWPALDGAWVRLGPGSHLVTPPDRYAGAADLSGRLRFMWDDSTLYVAGEIIDDDVTVGEAWDRDRVNLVFDWREDTTPLTYDEASPPSSAWQADDYWVYFQPFWEGGAGEPRRLDRRSHGPAAGARVASRRTADGYVFEAALPASALPEYSPFVGHAAGLQVFLSDGDGGEALSELVWSHDWGRDGGLQWQLWRMGRLLFADAPIG